MQDIVHGIKKVVGSTKTMATSQATPSVPTTPTAAPGVESLMKRGWLFIEDSDWKQAVEYFNKVLDIDPEHAPAYVGLLCAELKVRSEEGLANHEKPVDDMPHYKKAIRFADADYRAKLEELVGYNIAINERIEKERPKTQQLLIKQDQQKWQQYFEKDRQKTQQLLLQIEKERQEKQLQIEEEQYRQAEKRRQEEEQCRLVEEQHKQEEQRKHWEQQGLCRHCGGQMGGLFSKKCKSCGKTN
jgi:tetratricopeptide (TPR) repeat protein